MPYDVQELVREDQSGAHMDAEALAIGGAATPSAQPNVELSPGGQSAEHGGGQTKPVTQRATAAAKPSARRRVTGNRSTSASAGIAQTRRADQYGNGDPTLSDPANVVAQPAYLSPGPDDGLSAPRDSQGSAAVVPPSEPATSNVDTKAVVRARGAARKRPASQSTRGGSNPSGPTVHVATTDTTMSGRGGVHSADDDQSCADAADNTAPAVHAAKTKPASPGRGDGQISGADQSARAVAELSDPEHVPGRSSPRDRGDGPSRADDQQLAAVAVIVDLWRQRCAIQRTAIRVSLQAQAMCRRVMTHEDPAKAKEAAQKAWARIRKDPMSDDLAIVVEPYRQMVEVAEKHAHGLEKQLVKLVRKHPLWAWAKDVRGLGELSVAGIIGGAQGNPGDYKSVSALWKRFGLAVIDGQRQRKVADAEMALIHGYAPERRAFAYVVSCNLLKSQGSDGPYRSIYDRRKAYEMEERADPVTKAHAHNRALRVMVKALFRDVWAADRRLRGESVEP